MQDFQNNRWSRSVLSLFVLVMTIVSLFPVGTTAVSRARAATTRTVPYLQNGSFETVTSGVPDNWTVMGQRINLGVTRIAGCLSVDTVDYAA